jgi:hypothetical protein
MIRHMLTTGTHERPEEPTKYEWRQPRGEMPGWQLAVFFIGLALMISVMTLAVLYQTHITASNISSN